MKKLIYFFLLLFITVTAFSGTFFKEQRVYGTQYLSTYYNVPAYVSMIYLSVASGSRGEAMVWDAGHWVGRFGAGYDYKTWTGNLYTGTRVYFEMEAFGGSGAWAEGEARYQW